MIAKSETHRIREVRKFMGKTIGADSDRESGSSSNAQARLIAAVLALAALAAVPGVVVAIVFAVLAFEIRRVRVKMWTIWAAVTAIIGIAAAGFSLTTWLYWSTSFTTRIWLHTPAANLPPDSSGLLGWSRANADMSILQVIWTQLWFGVPVGFALAAVLIVLFRSRPRALRGRIEGAEHSNMRPVGILDRRRRDIERNKVASGHYLRG
ncbi:hypothetical protein AS032_31975 [Rhodococcus qingshengii]|nr:hypothetical protein AS032_31975 [Rhodococcus qingshengii]